MAKQTVHDLDVLKKPSWLLNRQQLVTKLSGNFCVSVDTCEVKLGIYVDLFCIPHT